MQLSPNHNQHPKAAHRSCLIKSGVLHQMPHRFGFVCVSPRLIWRPFPRKKYLSMSSEVPGSFKSVSPSPFNWEEGLFSSPEFYSHGHAHPCSSCPRWQFGALLSEGTRTRHWEFLGALNHWNLKGHFPLEGGMLCQPVLLLLLVPSALPETCVLTPPAAVAEKELPACFCKHNFNWM